MISINVRNLERCIGRLTTYRDLIEAKNNLLLQRLMEYGCTVASVEFTNAVYDGTNDVTVTVTEDNGIYKIVANGKAVAFIEFGSGATYGGTYPYVEVGGIKTHAGSWSLSPAGKGHYADEGGWYYEHGKKSTGNPPAMALYNASKDMRRILTQIAKEVYGND